jgi:tetraacyldisaccharide 4'-kinase
MMGSGSDEFLDASTDISMLKGKRALAFAGLADNAQFFDALRQADCQLVQTVEYEDHHTYDPIELDRIAALAEKQAVDMLITTLKDYVKIEGFARIPRQLVVVDVAIRVVGDEDRLLKSILIGKKIRPSKEP